MKQLYYKMGQALLQSKAALRYCKVTRGNRYYNEGGTCITKREALLQSGTGITNWGKSYQKWS